MNKLPKARKARSTSSMRSSGPSKKTYAKSSGTTGQHRARNPIPSTGARGVSTRTPRKVVSGISGKSRG